MVRLEKPKTGVQFTNSAVAFFVCTWSKGLNMLGGQCTPVAQVIEGMDVVDRLTEEDTILSVTAIKVPRHHDGKVSRMLIEPKIPKKEKKEEK